MELMQLVYRSLADPLSHWKAMMVGQATLNDVMLQIQRRRFGTPEERAAGHAAATKLR
ncbi:hypothetical protein [Piscinibacter koreensis]|uniref:Uncharacterized protein n=1 Tax=Piscinibacter koreensis TaxID=2742824 RepID=A0A7Y6NQD2_9BURK|nr:hypothetical protein [Schlegelella koreensis]NUZ07380.1 hypothetical protein [Schlegelella koreensis]